MRLLWLLDLGLDLGLLERQYMRSQSRSLRLRLLALAVGLAWAEALACSFVRLFGRYVCA